MKRYIPTLILLVIDVICVVIFNLNSKVLEDGTLSEPFVKNRKDKEKL